MITDLDRRIITILLNRYVYLLCSCVSCPQYKFFQSRNKIIFALKFSSLRCGSLQNSLAIHPHARPNPVSKSIFSWPVTYLPTSIIYTRTTSRRASKWNTIPTALGSPFLRNREIWILCHNSGRFRSPQCLLLTGQK